MDSILPKSGQQFFVYSGVGRWLNKTAADFVVGGELVHVGGCGCGCGCVFFCFVF